MAPKSLDKPLGFVVPWYGDNIPGGAERLCREYVRHLADAGLEVEVLTTCAREFQSNWNKNHYRPKTVEKHGVKIRRFPVRRRDSVWFDAINFKLLNNLGVNAHEEQAFFFESIRSEELENYLKANAYRYHLVFMPYCYGTTYEGLRNVNFRGFLIPCLHRERYAFLRGTRKMHENVLGLIFNSESEQKLARELYSIEHVAQIVLGLGVEPEKPADPRLFRQKYGLRNPYIICLGRKDVTKNTHVLVGYFAQFIEDNPQANLDLVLVGPGDVEIPRSAAKRIHNIGFVPEAMKRSALAGAQLLVQPSARESFSIVLMEAWMAGTPVAVNAFCGVGVEHCRRSNGGLYFTNYAEFAEVVRLLTTDTALAARLAENGRRYVLENYNWERIIEEFVEFIRRTAHGG